MEIAMTTDFEGVSTSTEEIRETLRKISDAGFSHIHWCHEWDGDYTYSMEEMYQIRGWMNELGLRCKGIHATEGSRRNAGRKNCFQYRYVWQDRRDYTSENEYNRRAGVELIRNRVQMAEILGTDAIVLHMQLPYKDFEENPEFKETIYKYMVLRDEIMPDQVCMILYDQSVLDTQDGDFAEWQRGSISSYELVLRKIQRLEITPGDLALDPCSGSAVVTDADTGKVLACVSCPGYDNNRLANQMDDEYYYRIYNNAALPLYNRATQQLSAPGSTFKPVTIIAGLSEGVTGVSTPVMCNGVFDKVDPPLRCWNHSGHGNVAGAADALQHSCNDYLCEVFYRLGMKGQQTFSDGQLCYSVRHRTGDEQLLDGSAGKVCDNACKQRDKLPPLPCGPD